MKEVQFNTNQNYLKAQPQQGLFVDDNKNQQVSDNRSESNTMSKNPVDGKALEDRKERTQKSMLWAAYADALGFISESVDDRGLKRRIGERELNRLMPWKRKIGGRGGVEVELLAGCWSDDTQLRMAVCRAMSHHGFNTEAFARIELPVWPAYALGAGLASKAAAANLSKRDTLWYANTFRGWTDAGGNGAAMRIQPHVWASTNLENDYMLDVIIDCVCTHGHPRAIVGACFHASTLAHCLRAGDIPDWKKCKNIAIGLKEEYQKIESHSNLGSTWMTLWEKETGEKFKVLWDATVDELYETVQRAEVLSHEIDHKIALTDKQYHDICEGLGLRIKHQRGSGILTTVAAVALAQISQDSYEGVHTAANALKTDTDSIGTMTGALLGASYALSEPPQEVLDSEYLRYQADRLVAISQGQQVDSHSYPDILTWVAPQTQADSLVIDNGHLIVEGLGKVTKLEIAPFWAQRKSFAWQWVRTDFGQTLLIKHRPELRPLKTENRFEPPPTPAKTDRFRKSKESEEQCTDVLPVAPLDRGINLDDAIEYVKDNIFDDRHLGYTVRRVARDGKLEGLVAIVSALRDDLRSAPPTSPPPPIPVESSPSDDLRR